MTTWQHGWSPGPTPLYLQSQINARDKPLLLLLQRHDRGDKFLQLAEAMADQFDLVVPDLRGHGPPLALGL